MASQFEAGHSGQRLRQPDTEIQARDDPPDGSQGEDADH